MSFKKLHADAMVPAYQSEQAAGADLHACLTVPVVIEPGKIVLIPIGIAIALPVGYEAQIRPRSGLAAKAGVTVLNSPGTIDSDYRGELKALLINHGERPFTVTHGERIAQLVVAKHETVNFDEVQTLDETMRGLNGFGSTGK